MPTTLQTIELDIDVLLGESAVVQVTIDLTGTELLDLTGFTGMCTAAHIETDALITAAATIEGTTVTAVLPHTALTAGAWLYQMLLTDGVTPTAVLKGVVTVTDQLADPDLLTYAAYIAGGGTLSSAEFASVLPGATAAVNEAIWPNSVTDATRAAYWRAIGAVAEIGDERVVSEGVGKTQVSYASSTGARISARRTTAIQHTADRCNRNREGRTNAWPTRVAIRDVRG